MKKKWREQLTTMSVGQQFIAKSEENARMDKIRRYAPLILLIIMTVIGAVSQKNFFTWANIVNIMYQMSIPLVISVGLSFVLLLGSIDLSIEGNMGFAGSLAAYLVINNSNSNDFGIWGILFVVLIGAGVGTITGFLHTKARIASFIVSYAIGCIMTGAAVLIYRGTPIQVKDPMFNAISQGKLIGIPYLTLISFAVFIIGAIIMNYTAFGRAVYAIGDNETAAASTGINITKTKIKVFALSGCTAAIAGVLLCMRLKLGQSSGYSDCPGRRISKRGQGRFTGILCRCTDLHGAGELADADGSGYKSQEGNPGRHHYHCRRRNGRAQQKNGGKISAE